MQPLANRHHQRQQRKADEKPGGEIHFQQRGAGQRAQQETGGNGEHVDDHLVFPEQRIAQRDDQIRQRDPDELVRQCPGGGKAEQRHHYRQRDGGARADAPGGNWPLTFHRMGAIFFTIEDIVDQNIRPRKRRKRRQNRR